MATPQPKRQQQDHPVVDQQLKLASLMQSGGLIVIGETVITLHEEEPDNHSWVTIGYGIPCLAASEEQLVVSVTGIDNGETLYEFRLSSREFYKEIDHHFHVLTATMNDSDEYKTYGMTFAHEKVAERFFAAVKQLAPNEVNYSRPRRYSRDGQQLVSIEATDLPSLHSDSGRYQAFSVEEAGALTASGRFKNETEEESAAMDDDQAVQLQQEKVGGAEITEGLEEVDQPNMEKQMDTSRDRVDISHPTGCKHIAHVGSDTPVHTLVRVIKNGEDPNSIPKCDDRTEHSPSPLPPPPMTDVQNLLQKMTCSLNLNKKDCSKEDTKQTGYDSQTAEEDPEENFHKVIGKLIHKKLHDEAIYTKLVSFTASGREEKCEKPTTRAASVIIHDHGIVCL